MKPTEKVQKILNELEAVNIKVPRHIRSEKGILGYLESRLDYLNFQKSQYEKKLKEVNLKIETIKKLLEVE